MTRADWVRMLFVTTILLVGIFGLASIYYPVLVALGVPNEPLPVGMIGLSVAGSLSAMLGLLTVVLPSLVWEREHQHD